MLGPRRLIGVSCHTPQEAAEASDGDADFIVFGPLFPTPSKAAYGPPVGLGRLRDARRQFGRTILGIGGVTAENAADVMRAGGGGVAVVSAVMAAGDPAEAVRGLLAVTQRALRPEPRPTCADERPDRRTA
jgi:thiamine-phosphate pyrophosphorylase